MLLALPLLAGMLWGLLSGGNLGALEKVSLRYPLLLILAFVPSLVLYTPPTNRSAWAIQYSPLIYPILLTLMAVALLVNRHLSRGVSLIVAGLCLNLIVVVANGGSMPVDPAAQSKVMTPRYVRMMAERRVAVNTHRRDAQSRLVFLSDILPLNAPGGLGNVYSVGDVLVACGALLLGRDVLGPRRLGPPPA